MASRNILITGASSGLGAALARVYAVQGVRLFLWGRDEARLSVAAAECRARGAIVETGCFDLRQIDLMVSYLRDIDEAWPLDLAIFNAGVGGEMSSDEFGESPERAHEIVTVNFTVPVIAASTLAQRMAERLSGHIVLVGSISELYPLPMAPTYVATKAGLSMFLEALALRLVNRGIRFTLVSPGFVDTPMSRSLTRSRMFLMTSEKAAALIAKKIARGKTRIIIPWQFAMIAGISRLLPRAAIRGILRRI